MRIMPVLLIAFLLGALPAAARAAAGTGYEGLPPAPVVPGQIRLPAFLPNGVANLEEIWTEEGGARPYWNSVRRPIQLRMGGATWVDPALVPDLFTPVKKAAPVRKRTRKRATHLRKKPLAAAKVPAKAGATALKKPAAAIPAVPLPVNRIRPAKPPVLAEPLVTDDYSGPVTPLQ